jgi:hypothetical protein
MFARMATPTWRLHRNVQLAQRACTAALTRSVRRLLIALFTGVAVAACTAPWSPPTPKEILAKPGHAGINDAHFSLRPHVISGAFSIDMTGDGLIVEKPQRASRIHYQGSLGQIPLAIDQIEIADRQYSRTGTDKWTESPAKDQSTNPESWSAASDPQIMGEETLPLGKAWRMRATHNGGQAFDAWIRQSDGYPLKYSGDFSARGTATSTDRSGSLAVEFDRFNTGSKIAAPPASEIKPEPKSVSGRVGQPMPLTGVTVTVVQADLNRQPSNSYLLPKAGNRFVVVEVLYESSGTDNVRYNPYDWS